MIAQDTIISDYTLSPDIVVMTMLLIGTNIHLMTGNSDTSLVFMPNEAFTGEWWRYITHPFVHLSLHHG